MDFEIYSGVAGKNLSKIPWSGRKWQKAFVSDILRP
jgi:hypothetical protein